MSPAKKLKELEQQDFERLLSWLDVDRERAGFLYEQIRWRLITILAARGCTFAEELADPEKLHIPKKLEPGKRELDMAKALVGSMSTRWNPEKYHDDYREALMEVIEEKVEAGGKGIEEKPKKAPKPTKVIDLVSVLQKSLEQSGAAKKKSRGKRTAHANHRQKKAA